MLTSDMLREGDIVLGVAAKGKRSLLARIAAQLGERAGIPEGVVLASLLKRERLGSTGIGRGVAIPHARFDGIDAPAATLARLRKPVWFDAPDEAPVDLVLALLWPKADAAGFLPALAGACRLLRSADLLARLRTAQSPAEAHALLDLPEVTRDGQACGRATGGARARAWRDRPGRLAPAGPHRNFDWTAASTLSRPATAAGEALLRIDYHIK